MERIKEVNLIENKKLIIGLNIVSIPVFILFLFLFSCIPILLEIPEKDGNLLVTFFYFILLIGAFLFHELVHGFFFKLFHKDGKVSFGFKNGMLYATSPNSFYPKNNYAVITVAPFVVVTLLFFIGLVLGLLTPRAFTILASAHAAGCVGDFYWLHLIRKAPKDAYVEDTLVGISFYQP